jgi:hypothetical protein
MELYDANHDGFLDPAELEKVPGLKAALKEVDTDHDGKISQPEIAARIKSWADSKIGRVQVTYRVMHGGKPLAGATVLFKPEPFLGGAIQSGSGTTSAWGVGVISSANAATPAVRGLSPGFYRIEITKSGESIPAKYNSETTLGVEAAGDSAAAKKGLMFDLQY